MSTMLINCIYASTSGNVEAVVEKIAEQLSANGVSANLHRAEQTNPEIFNSNDVFIFATSTWEHGEINPFFKTLLAKMQSLNFSGKSAAFIGLGDNRYEPVLFNTGIEKIKETWTKNGGTQIFRTLKINGSPYQLLDSVVTQWSQDLLNELKKNTPIESLLLGKT